MSSVTRSSVRPSARGDVGPLIDARERGYRVGVLESSELGYNVYKRLGFKDYGPIEQYLFMPTGG